MSAISLRCRRCEAEHPLVATGVCSKCFAPLEPVYDYASVTLTRAEIERRAAETRDISAQAVTAVDQTNTTVVGLSTASGQISRVIKLINDILLLSQLEANRVSLRVLQAAIQVDSKSKDNVFVSLAIAVQYQVKPGAVQDAVYTLTDHARQIGTRVPPTPAVTDIRHSGASPRSEMPPSMRARAGPILMPKLRKRLILNTVRAMSRSKP